MTARDHAPRRRASLLLAGAVALSVSGCALLPGQAPPSSSGEPVETLTPTPTDDATASSSTSPSGDPTGPKPQTPDPVALADDMRTYMDAASSVTIRGTLHDTERDMQMKIHAEGSTAGLAQQVTSDAGISRTTLEFPGGGTMESIVVGWDHYLRVDQQWIDTRKPKLDSPLRKRVGEWVKVPRQQSPVEQYKPHRLLKSSFFGVGLTPEDVRRSPASTVALGDEWAYLLQLNKAGKEGGNDQQRQVWLSTDGNAALLKMTYGAYPARTTLSFSDWGSSRENWKAPAGARTLKEFGDEDL